MKSIQYERCGGLDRLKLVDVAQPVPGSGQVMVRVRAASVNPMDGKIRPGEMKMLTGRRFPPRQSGKLLDRNIVRGS